MRGKKGGIGVFWEIKGEKIGEKKKNHGFLGGEKKNRDPLFYSKLSFSKVHNPFSGLNLFQVTLLKQFV